MNNNTKTLKIAHIADCHLRQRQYGYPQRGEDFLKGILSAITTAHEQGADIILVAGDMLDSTNPGAAVCIDQLDEIQSVLKELKFRMYITSGNHDKTYPHWCSRFNKFFSEDTGGMRVIDNDMITISKGDISLSIYGLPFMSDNEFRDSIEELPKADILVWHAAIKEFTGYPTDNAISCAELNCGKWKLVAMGDQHIHKYLKEGDTTIAYPGSTELCSTSEDFEKQLLMYTWTSNDDFKIDSIPFTTRKKQQFVVKTEKELDKAISEFDESSIIFIKYAKEIPNASFKINKALKSTNIARLIPLTSTKKNGSDITVKELRDPVSYLRDNINILVKDTDRAQRISSLCVSVLSQDIDYMKDVEQYCESKLNSTK